MISENINTEIIITGDRNINYKIWSKNEEEKSQYEKNI